MAGGGYVDPEVAEMTRDVSDGISVSVRVAQEDLQRNRIHAANMSIDRAFREKERYFVIAASNAADKAPTRAIEQGFCASAWVSESLSNTSAGGIGIDNRC